MSNDLQKFEIDSLDEKESINKYNSIKKQFLPEKIKKNEIDFEISSEKQNLTKCNLLNENIPKEFLKNILPVSKNNNSEIIKSNNNELQNKLIFQFRIIKFAKSKVLKHISSCKITSELNQISILERIFYIQHFLLRYFEV